MDLCRNVNKAHHPCKIRLLKSNLLLTKCVNTLWTGVHTRPNHQKRMFAFGSFFGETVSQHVQRLFWPGCKSSTKNPPHCSFCPLPPLIPLDAASQWGHAAPAAALMAVLNAHTRIPPIVRLHPWYVATAVAFCTPQVLILYTQSCCF